MAANYNLCLDIGGTKVLGAIFDPERRIVYRLKKKTRSGGGSAENIEQVIVSVVHEMLEGSGIAGEEIHAIAAAAPGVIDQARGVVLTSANLPWENYDIKSAVEAATGIPFYIGNDVNVGVLGEYKYGAARGYHNVVGFFVGTGMGGGLILNDELYTGHLFKGAELGHMILSPKGPLCGCGQRGCLEAYSSKKGMSAYILEQAARGRKSMLTDSIENGVFRSKKLKKALEAGDAVAAKAVDRACHYLAVATGNVINIFSPDLVVYGGGVIEAVGDLFLEKILAEVDRYCMPSIRSSVELKKAELGDDSVLYGDLAMIEEARF